MFMSPGSRAKRRFAATKEEQQVGTTQELAVTPSQAQSHDSAAKAWVMWTGSSSPTITASYNIASVTLNSTGDYTITMATPFSTANYVIHAMGSNDGAVDASIVRRANAALTTTQARLLFTNTAGANANANPGFFIAYGRQ